MLAPDKVLLTGQCGTNECSSARCPAKSNLSNRHICDNNISTWYMLSLLPWDAMQHCILMT